jgi:Zn-dependent protease with chaperone function
MSTNLWLRTVCAAALLVAFPSMLVVLLVVLVGAETWLAVHSLGNALNWAIAIVPVSIVVVRGLRVLLSEVGEPVRGVPLTEPEHPELWGLVRRLASVCATRPPDEIHLDYGVTASVVEETRLLGLVSTRRRLVIGAPLVADMRADQLAAVLAHELAHYGHWDTRLSTLAYRGRRAFVSTVSALDRTVPFEWFLSVLLNGWLRLYLRVSSGLSQRQERAADTVAARAVGAAAMASALREIAVTTTAWQSFTEHHLVMAWDAGYLPADVFGGYAELRNAMRDRLDRIRRNPPDTRSGEHSHPPIASRVADLEAMTTPPAVACGQQPAAALLHDAATALDAAVVAGLGPAAGDKRRADWATLAQAHGAPPAAAASAALLASAARLTDRPATIRTVLAALDDGRLADLAGVRPMSGVGPRGRREQARPVVRDGLRAAVGLAMAGVGAASWQPAWPSCARLAVDPRWESRLPGLIEAAVADRPDTTGLRAVLATTNVDVDATV